VTFIAIISTPNNIFPRACEYGAKRASSRAEQMSSVIKKTPLLVYLQGLMVTHAALPLKRHGYTDDPVNLIVSLSGTSHVPTLTARTSNGRYAKQE
jgi:hypothetical protein